jgi:hypothetical protein
MLLLAAAVFRISELIFGTGTGRRVQDSIT